MGTLSNTVKTIQELPGAFAPNLFEVTLFGEAVAVATGAGKATDDFEFRHYWTKQAILTRDSDPTKLLCSKINIPGMTIDYESRHKVLKEVFAKEVKIPDEISISWYETHTLDVWNYHRAWLACFYNRQTDQYVTSPTGKKRLAQVSIHQMPLPDGTFPVTQAHIFSLEGLQPVNIPELTLDWAGGGEASIVTVKYKVDRIRYLANAVGALSGAGMDLL